MSWHGQMSLRKQNLSLSFFLSLSSLSHTHTHTHWGPSSQRGESKHLMNEGQLRCKFLFPYWLCGPPRQGTYFIRASVSPFFFFFSVPIFVSWDQWYPRTRGVGNHLGLIYVNPWHQILSDCVLIYVLNISFASTPWMSPQRPRARTGCSYCPRVWRDGELEFHSS